MKDRKAFTLVELLVVIGIIALLAGILLPAVNHMRRSAQITGQKADFESIGAALNAYKADFGDYPRNADLPKWNTLIGNRKTPAPIFYSLASALIGPGPAVTEQVGTNLEIGDGSDGPGIRCEISGAIPSEKDISPTLAAGSTLVTIPLSPQYTAQAAALANNFVSPSATPTSITFFPTAATNPPPVGYVPYPETVGVASVQPPASGQITLQLLWPTAVPHNGNCLITQPSGKVWGPYISADTFKVAFVPSGSGGPTLNQITGGWGQPILLDRWGQVIQYFPTYGQVGNRANDSYAFKTPAAIAAVSVGPLFGYSQAWSLENESRASDAQNAIWDYRDAVPTFSVANSTTPTQYWPDPTFTPLSSFNPQWAIQWMLGDQPNPSNPAAPLDDVIMGAEKLSYSGPYILISAGPDGPLRTNGGFCNMNGSLPPDKWQQTFIDSGNIYNFDRQ